MTIVAAAAMASGPEAQSQDHVAAAKTPTVLFM
jgi:hypothetical protein